MKLTLPVFILFLFFSMATIQAQSDCIQSLTELQKDPIRIDTIIKIDPATYEESTMLEYVYLDIDEKTPIERTIEKGDQTLYYVRKEDCLLIQRIKMKLK